MPSIGFTTSPLAVKEMMDCLKEEDDPAEPPLQSSAPRRRWEVFDEGILICEKVDYCM